MSPVIYKTSDKSTGTRHSIENMFSAVHDALQKMPDI